MKPWHGWLALGVLALVVAFMVGRGDGGDKEREQFKSDRAAWQNERAELTAEKQILLDSLGAHARADSATMAQVDTLAARYDRERAARRELLTSINARILPTDTGRLAQVARDAVVAATAAHADADTLRGALTRTRAVLDQSTRDLAAVLAHSERQDIALDSCNALLERAPIDEEKFLGLPLPSRKTVAAGSALVTAVVTVLILK